MYFSNSMFLARSHIMLRNTKYCGQMKDIKNKSIYYMVVDPQGNYLQNDFSKDRCHCTRVIRVNLNPYFLQYMY